jgi:protein TonB
MLKAAPAGGGQAVYRGPNEIDARQRVLALGAVAVLHAAVVGGFIYAQMRPPPPPPEQTLSVSFITESAAASAPAPPQPPQPTPPPPEARLMATPKPTPSPMTAPPQEVEPRRETPKQPAPAAPAASPARPSAAPAAAAASPSSAAPTAATATPPNFTAAYLNNPGAVYPIASRRKRDQGVVLLRVQVGADGLPDQVLLDRSSGHSELDAAALDVVKKRWRFAPAKQGDRAIVGWVIVPMEFELKSR